MSKLRTLVRRFESVLVEKKSRFVTFAAPVSSEVEAKAFIESVSDPKASHNCYAYRIDEGTFRYSDDGEPGGTAGAPMYSALAAGNFVYTAVVVVRYFGGKKLGAAGLTRAYGRAVSDCLACSETAPFVPTVKATVRVGFDAVAATFRAVERYQRLNAINSTEGCEIHVAVPLDARDSFVLELRNVTKGTAKIEFDDK